MDQLWFGVFAFVFIAGLIFFISKRKSKKNTNIGGGGAGKPDEIKPNENQTT